MRHNPFHILRAAHAELHVTDLAKSRAFYVDVLGFIVTEETPTEIYLRGVEERLHHSLILKKAETPTVGHMSFRVETNEDVEALYEFYRAQGCDPRIRDQEEELGQGMAVMVRDPFGFPVEFFADMASAESYHQKYHLHRGGAVRRIDHFNLFVPDFERAFDFWTKDMGFKLTEYVESDEEPREKTAAWLCRKSSVHDLAMMKGAGPRVHHVGFWMDDIMSIIRICDILGSAAMHEHIERGPGRHGISNAFFLYLRDPDGHRIELYTCDYLTIDPDLEPIRWSATDPRRQTLWGHTTPESWWREASTVLDVRSSSIVSVQSGPKLEAMAEHIK
jgi:catechol 2,3-dioxygenase